MRPVVLVLLTSSLGAMSSQLRESMESDGFSCFDCRQESYHTLVLPENQQCGLTETSQGASHAGTCRAPFGKVGTTLSAKSSPDMFGDLRTFRSISGNEWLIKDSSYRTIEFENPCDKMKTLATMFALIPKTKEEPAFQNYLLKLVEDVGTDIARST